MFQYEVMVRGSKQSVQTAMRIVSGEERPVSIFVSLPEADVSPGRELTMIKARVH